MSIMDRIRQELEEMTRSERLVAAFVLGHMNDIAFYTLDHLAQQVDTSTTSVLRFCRRLGFDGYKLFQQAVRADLRYNPSLTDKFHRTTDQQLSDSMLAQTVQQGVRCIEQTFRQLPFEDITQAVQRLAQARRVYTFGMRESQALAMYAYSRLLTVRGDVFLFQEGFSDNVEALLSLTKEDVFLVYLFHRYTGRTLRLLELLQKRGVQILLVTSPPWEGVARFATVLLPCQVDANGIKNSALGPVCLADYLCNAVAAAGGEKTLQRMSRSEELFKQSGILDE